MKNGRIYKASLWLAFIMSLVFAGCGSKSESPDPAKPMYRVCTAKTASWRLMMGTIPLYR